MARRGRHEKIRYWRAKPHHYGYQLWYTGHYQRLVKAQKAARR